MSMKRVAVLMGGTSSEREVSLRSGAAVAKGLADAGFEVVPVTLTSDSLDPLPRDVDAVFIALHGGYGENGGVQRDLEALGLPYTGPNSAASKIAMDKIATKRVLEAAGVPTAPYAVLERGDDRLPLELPVVVKPPRDGSSVGVYKVTEPGQWAESLAGARAADPIGEVLVESYIPGREWTVGLVGDTALPVVEIQAANGWYGFAEKYTAGTTKYVFPEAEGDIPLIAECQRIAKAAFKAIGGRGMSRVDFRVTPEGKPFVLEINTVPGFTATSLLPKAAARAGMEFSELCAKIIGLAAC